MGIGLFDYGRVVACCYAIGVFDVRKLGRLNYGGVLACFVPRACATELFLAVSCFPFVRNM